MDKGIMGMCGRVIESYNNGDGYVESKEKGKVPSKGLLEKAKKLLVLMGGGDVKVGGDTEWESLMGKKDALNKAFEEKVYSHIHDRYNYKEAMFFPTVYGLLKQGLQRKKKDINIAKRVMDEACSYVITNADEYIKRVHGGAGGSGLKRETDVVTIREPLRSDPNKDKFKKGFKFSGKILKEIPGKPHEYEMEFSGSGLTTGEYKVDSTKTELDLDEGDKYVMEVVSGRESEGKGSVFFIKMHGAVGSEGGIHLTILARQVQSVLEKAIDDFLKEKLPELTGDMDRIRGKQKDLTILIEELEGFIKKAEGSGGEISYGDLSGYLKNRFSEKVKKTGIIPVKVAHKVLENLKHELSEQGLDFGGGNVGEGERFETHEMSQYLEDDPYKHFHNEAPGGGFKQYMAPGVSEIAEEFSEEDYEKLKSDLKKSFKSDEKMHGIPVSDVLEMMWDSIDSTDIGKKSDAWKAVFIEKVKEYAQKNNIAKLKGTESLYNVAKELISGVQLKIMNDARFRKMREMLLRFVTQKYLKVAGVDLEMVWKDPTPEAIRSAYTDALLMVPGVEGVRKDIGFEEAIGTPTVKGFHDFLGRGEFSKVLEILKVMDKVTPPSGGRGKIVTPMYAPSEPGEHHAMTALKKLLIKYKVDEKVGGELLELMKGLVGNRVNVVETISRAQKILDNPSMEGIGESRIRDLFEDFKPAPTGVFDKLLEKVLKDHDISSSDGDTLEDLLDDLTDKSITLEEATEKVNKMGLGEDAKKKVLDVYEQAIPKKILMEEDVPEAESRTKELAELNTLLEGVPEAEKFRTDRKSVV
jgi:hypothetical protein